MKAVFEIYTFLKNRTKIVRKRSAHRFRIFLKYHLKRENKEPVFIIASRRTGSNLLVDYLNSIPNVSFAWEILNKDMSYGLRSKFISKQAVLRHVAHSINNCEHKICGAKLIKIHMDTHDIRLSDLKELFPNARFIILYRRSLLEQFVSLKIAETTNVWRWKEGFTLPPSVHVSVPEFKKFCEQIKLFYRGVFENKLLNSCSTIINYEELCADPQRVFDESIFPILGLKSCPISTKLKKQNTKPLSQIVENYEEVAQLVGDQRYEKNYPVAKNEISETLKPEIPNPVIQEKLNLRIWGKIFHGAEVWVKTGWFILQHKKTPKSAKLLVGAAVAYLVSPIDIIPDFIPVLGNFDDLIVVSTLLWFATKLTPKDVFEDCRKRANLPKDTMALG